MKQLENLWRVAFVTTVWCAHNRAIHNNIRRTHHGLMVNILSLIREAQAFKLGTMLGIDDLVICRRLRVPVVPRPPRTTITVR